MTDDIKDEFIEQALRLSNETLTVTEIRHFGTLNGAIYCTSRAILAHARTLQETAAKMQEVSDVARHAVAAGYDVKGMRDLILPQPDPDEELAREVAKEFRTEGTTAWLECSDVALATIKALREIGWGPKELPHSIANTEFSAARAKP